MRIRLPYWFFFAAVPAFTGLFGCDALRLDRASAAPEVTWTLAPDIGLADGQSPIRVALSVNTPDGGPMAQVPLVLTSDEPSDAIVQPGLTDAYGRAQADIRASVQGLHHLAVWLDDGLARKELDAKIQIKFAATTSGNANPRGTAPDTPIPIKLEILATPTDGDRDPLAPTQFTLMVTDSAGSPVARQFVTFAATRPNDTLTPTSGVTDSQGRFVVTLTAGRLGTAGVRVQAGTVVTQSTINVVAGAANLARSSFRAANTTPIADGKNPQALTVQLFDAYQNPVPNVSVTFSSSVASDVFTGVTSVTNTAGQATSSITAVSKGVRQLQAKASSLLLTTDSAFVAGPAVAASSTLTASPNAVKADGNSPATLSLIVHDAYGNIVPNAAVSWTSDANAGIFMPSTTTTDADGRASGTLTSTRAQDLNIIANCESARIPTSVRFYPGPIDGNQSSLVAQNDLKRADGQSPLTLTVHLRDAQQNPIPNVLVTFSSVEYSDAFANPTAVTGVDGQATTAVTAVVAGVRQLQAQAAAVLFTANGTFVAGAPAVATSTFTADPNTATADGNSPLMLSMQLRDAYQNPVPNVSVTFRSVEGSDVFFGSTAVTGADGQATSSVTALVAGARQLQAQAEGVLFTANGTFVAGPALAATSTVTANPTTATADGNNPLMLTMQLRDAYQNPVPNVVVTFSSTEGSDEFVDPSAVTGVDGQATTTVTAVVAGVRQLQAQAAAVLFTANGTFVAGAPAVATSTFTAEPNTATADGNSPLMLTVQLRDSHQNPVPNVLVTFSSTEGSDVFTSVTASTGADGRATSSVTATVAGVRQLRAQAAGALLTINSTFVAGPAAVATSTLTASPNAVLADGNSPATLLLIARDASGNSVPNAAVSWSSDAGGCLFTPPTTTTDANGRAGGTVTSTWAKDQTIVADCSGTRIFAPLRFYPGPLDGNQSSIVGQNDFQPADGLSPVSIVVSLDDAWDNGLPNLPVQLAMFGNPSKLMAQSGSTNTFGQFTTTLVSRYAGVHPITAQSGSVKLMGTAHFAARTPLCGGNVLFGGIPLTHGGLGAYLSQLAAADLNADGNLDLITTDSDDNTVSVFFGQGNGAYAPRIVNPVGVAPRAVAVADLNGDGRLDLVVANRNSDNVSVLLQQSQGTFASAVSYPLAVGSRPQSIVVSDFNKDGFQDIVTANGAGSVSLILGRGNGTFAASRNIFTTSGQVANIVATDLNHDGIKDIVTANTSAATVSVLLGKGDGTFLTAVSYPVGSTPVDVVAVDINEDGHNDVATANSGSDTVSILLGRGDGTLGTAKSVSVGSGPQRLAVLDLNSDGKKDIVTVDFFPETVSVLINQGNVTFLPRQAYSVPYNAAGLLVVDVTSDGRPDILVSNYYDFIVTGQGYGNGEFAFPKRTNYAVQAYPGSVIATDLNNDGKPDIAVVNGDSNSVSILLAQPGGNFLTASHYPSGTSPRDIDAADLNNDGNVDLVVANNTGTVSVLMGRGDGTLAPPVSYASGSSAVAVTVADINGDSLKDMLVLNHNDNTMSVFLGQQSGGFLPVTEYSVGTHPTDLVSVDLNNDGVPDVVTVNSDGTINILMGSVNGGFAGIISYPTSLDLINVAARDFNEDGFMDIVTKSLNSEKFVLLINKGDGTLKPATTWGTGSPTGTTLLTEDLDRDGHLDVIIFSEHGTVARYLGRGDGTFSNATIFESASSTDSNSSGYAVDLDGDGIVELIVSGNNTNTVNIIKPFCLPY